MAIISSFTNILRFESKLETVIKTRLPLAILQYNTQVSPTYQIPVHLNIHVGSVIGEGDGLPQADVKPLVNVFSLDTGFKPSSINGCREELSNYRIAVIVPDSDRASRSSSTIARVLTRIVADIIETHGVDSPADTNAICFKIDWLKETYGYFGRTGAAAQLDFSAYLRSSSFYEPTVAQPFNSSLLGTNLVQPPTYEQNWIDELTVTVYTDAVTPLTPVTVTPQSLTVIQAPSIHHIDVTYTDDILTLAQVYFPEYAIANQLATSTDKEEETLTIDVQAWNTLTYSGLTAGAQRVLRLTAWDEDKAKNIMFSLVLEKT